MAATPTWSEDFITASVLINTANTNRDGTGSPTLVYTARAAGGTTGGKGASIDTLTVWATGTTTAGVIRLYVDNGTSRLIREILVTAITPSATVKAWTIPVSEGADVGGRLAFPVRLAPGDILRVSTHNAEAFVVRVEGGEN